jgi:hypothetical protein
MVSWRAWGFSKLSRTGCVLDRQLVFAPYQVAGTTVRLREYRDHHIPPLRHHAIGGMIVDVLVDFKLGRGHWLTDGERRRMPYLHHLLVGANSASFPLPANLSPDRPPRAREYQCEEREEAFWANVIEVCEEWRRLNRP